MEFKILIAFGLICMAIIIGVALDIYSERHPKDPNDYLYVPKEGHFQKIDEIDQQNRRSEGSDR